jgi:hypothetical protein
MKKQININSIVQDLDLNVGVVKLIRKNEALVEFDENTKISRKLSELTLVESEEEKINTGYALSIGESVTFNFTGQKRRGIVKEKLHNETFAVVENDGTIHRRHINDIFK